MGPLACVDPLVPRQLHMPLTSNEVFKKDQGEEVRSNEDKTSNLLSLILIESRYVPIPLLNSHCHVRYDFDNRIVRKDINRRNSSHYKEICKTTLTQLKH